MNAFFDVNYAILASASGQAFFVIGLLAAWEFRRYSRLMLARPLWMLAAFGLLYALAEWGRLFIPIQERYLPHAVTETLWVFRVLLMAASFGGLLQFGIELLPPRSRHRLRIAAPVAFLFWLGMTVGGGRSVGDLDTAIAIGELQARLFLALPAGLVGGLGLWLQQRNPRSIGGLEHTRWVRVASLCAVLTGLTLGLMLPGVGIWPGTERLLGMPAEVWRGLSAACFAFGLARILAELQLEQDRLLEEAERQVIDVQCRERLARELSDSVIQRLYAVGLLLGGVVGDLPPDDPARRAVRELDESITALRNVILDGSEAPHPPTPSPVRGRGGA
ncbi:MAG: histidine kinase [Chloroflexota bacterium]